jgi:ABC-2 type transport system permease protein
VTPLPAVRDAATVARYELKMQLRRPALWLTAILLFGFITYLLIDAAGKGGPSPGSIGWADVLRAAAHRSVLINMLFPVAAGLLLADRLSRDRLLGTSEVLDSAGLPAAARLWGKLAGAGGAVALMCLGYTLAASGYAAAVQDGPGALAAGLAAFLAIGLPAVAFVAAFSIVGGDLLGRALYLALFTGYWFWGNLIDPHAVPSLSCSLLSPVGGNVSSGLFGGTALYAGTCSQPPADPAAADAIASELILILAITMAMLAGQALLARRRATR